MQFLQATKKVNAATKGSKSRKMKTDDAGIEHQNDLDDVDNPKKKKRRVESTPEISSDGEDTARQAEQVVTNSYLPSAAVFAVCSCYST